MNKNYAEVLLTCIEFARAGKIEINVFELMYETGFPYFQLKKVLDELVLNNELSVIDSKQYMIVGDSNRNLDKLQAHIKQKIEIADFEIGEEDDEIDCSDIFYDDFIDEDELRYQAIKLCIKNNIASVSLIQRSFPIGFTKSCK